jgi:hypothetical protein
MNFRTTCLTRAKAIAVISMTTIMALWANVVVALNDDLIDASKVTFLMRTCSKGTMDDNNAMVRRVIGTVAPDIDLSQEVTVRQLLSMAATFAQSKCPSPYPFGSINVYLRPGDPATFTDYKQGFEYVPAAALGIVYTNPPDSVSASTGGSRFEPDKSQLTWRAIRNFGNEIRDRQFAEAAQARQREAELEKKRRAVQEKQNRSAAFAKANGVKRIVTAKELAANPFIFKGQVVAVNCNFKQMRSATEGLFAYGDTLIVVTGVPSARFTREGPRLLLAGRVQGNKEIKFPFGNALVPHLSYVGSASCDQVNCDN